MNVYDCLRWTNTETKEKLTWKGTLESMCACYGTFSGRWHSSAFWKHTAEGIPNMTEDECKQKVIQIENEANASLALWQAYQ